ncbi:MAG: hypothetical protein F6K19_13405 [Cyanothece sp. SIO1E1]|nr:hypothetical protein [Cyanothece sp. SIO1E1]
MYGSWSNCFERQTTLEEQYLYDHLLSCVQVESPAQVLARFRTLFIDGTGYSEPLIWKSVKKIVASATGQKEFKFILNRSCYILINRWLNQPRLQSNIPALIELFEKTPQGEAYSKATQRLRELVRHFTQTDQYLTLQRLATILNRSAQQHEDARTTPLKSLINRYPCLYEHVLLTDGNTDGERQQIKLLQVQKQQQFELDLSKYIISQLRPLQSDPVDFAQQLKVIQKPWQSFRNPTLLNDHQLDHAIRQFSGKADGFNSYRDLAQRFLTYSSQTPSYRTFKAELYEYLSASIAPKYGNFQFNQRLYNYLQDILPQSDAQKPNDMLIVGTCRKLLNFLIVESAQYPKHSNLVDLTANIGTPSTIGLMLKIVLLCRKVKPYLEKRFSILFNHYENYTREGVAWLVEALEHLNVALGIHFGTVTVPIF